MTTITTARFLGPARVQALRGDRLDLLTEEGPVTATLALAVPYDPAPGDVVLVIGEDEHYVIGVLKSRNRTVLSVPGDLDIRATGRVRIASDAAVELAAPRVTLRAEQLESIARTAYHRFTSSFSWIKGLLQTTAGRSRTVVEESATLQADRIVEKARKDVCIDGEKIRLG